MIPKIIHYCWFGHSPLPPLAVKCIESWKKYLPDYDIKEWNEDNFDVNIIPYTAEAYAAGKYAFVSDYARFWILYHYGGIYSDTDVEVITSLDDIIDKGAFIGFERNPDRWGKGLVNPGLGFAASAHDEIIYDLINKYAQLHFVLQDGSLNTNKTIVHYTTEVLEERGLKQVAGIQKVGTFNIYPSDYFAPIHFITKRLHISINTRTIHQYMASWENQKKKGLKEYIRHYTPEWLLIWYNRLL